MAKFLRRTWSRYGKLGKSKKKKQVWRKPKGRDNKMREKRKGCPASVSVGYKKKNSERSKIRIIRNLKDLEKTKKNEILVIGKLGKKKKIEIVKKAKEKNIALQNINIQKFLKKTEKLKTPEKEKEKKK
ncbi:MAG TPA: eL32 family ribosomal protein [Bacillota bacterium]|nr:eL32 family ribosomal protein [Bacillota bacterium]